MKKLSFLLLAATLTVGALTSCGNGAETKPAADTTAVKKDTTPVMAPAADTTAKDTSAGKTIVPPNSKK